MIGLTIDLQALNQAPPAFAYRVTKEGKPIFSRNEDAGMDYEERIRDFYFDFQPHLKRYLDEVLYGRN